MDGTKRTRLKALLLEDDEWIQKVFQKLFERMSWDLCLVSNLKEFESEISEIHGNSLFDLVLLDLGLSMDGGWELNSWRNGMDILKHLKNHPILKVVPVWILSGSMESYWKEESIRLGADMYLQKPFELTEIINKIENFRK